MGVLQIEIEYMRYISTNLLILRLRIGGISRSIWGGFWGLEKKVIFFSKSACVENRHMILYTSFFTHRGVVAQLVSALDCRSGGCGFEPRRPRQSEKIGRLPRGVMVAPQILILLVGVRVPARQPF